MEIGNKSLEELVSGYQKQGEEYACLYCGQVFAPGEVYPIGERFFAGKRAAGEHVRAAHPDRLLRLVQSPSKYNSLTANQKRLMELFAAGKSDKEVAGETGVSESTVRHQRFTFREKAKQARYYLTMYELAFDNRDDLMQIPDAVRSVDERFEVTEAEKEQVLKAAFESLNPLRLKTFPHKEKKKVVILTRIAEEFVQQREYSEQQINEILEEIFSDYVTLRRYLVDYGYLSRTRDGKNYWKNG